MKARIINVLVQPQIVIDDGENLTPQEVTPMAVAWRDWPTFAASGLQDALARMQEELDAASGGNAAGAGV
jgi:hypothetical protein